MYIRKILLIIVLIGLIVGGIFAYTIYGYIFNPNTSFNNKEATLLIRSDDSFDDVKNALAPLLTDLDTFEKVAKQKGYASNVKGGKYVIQKGMNNNDIVNALRSRNIPVKVAFNNQERLQDLAGRIASQIEPDSAALAKAFLDADFLSSNGFDDDSMLAMYIPNSYEFFWNTSATKFRDRMLKEYNRFWNDDRKAKAKALNLDPIEVVSLAAIVHKETAKVDERPRVAGLYLNRIRQGMLLQADPTVIYAMKKHQNNFDLVIKRVLYADLKLDSPYNTYMYKGVPPGPITMPDITAIDGVLNAEKHDYVYMVANVENFGYHKFAKTAAQHNRNKVQYIRWINEQKILR